MNNYKLERRNISNLNNVIGKNTIGQLTTLDLTSRLGISRAIHLYILPTCMVRYGKTFTFIDDTEGCVVHKMKLRSITRTKLTQKSQG